MSKRRLIAGLAAALGAAGACGAPSYKPLTIAELTRSDGWIALSDFLYRGRLQGGLPHGSGEVRYRNGVQVRGTFSHGTAVGAATIVIPRYGRIEGTMANGVLVKGNAFLDNGSQYTGGFRNWTPSGEGQLYDPSRGWYSGTFANGALHGQGMHIDPRTGTQTVARFVNGAPTGAAFVVSPSGGRGAHYENGRDVSTTARAAVAAAQLAEQARDQAKRAETEVATKRDVVNDLDEQIDRGRNLHTSRGVDAFNAACRLCNGGFTASMGADGRVRVTPGGEACLMIEPRDRTAEERRAIERAAERRRAQTIRACRAWARDIDDPSFPQRLAALQQQHRREGEALAAAIARKRAAEAAAERYRQEQAQRRYSEEVRRRAAEIEAAERREAEQRAARLREEKRRCDQNPKSYCLCWKFRPPPPPPPPGSSRASCQ